MATDSTHDPQSLWAASQERMQTSWVILQDRSGQKPSDLAAAVYMAGLAIELILQALSHFDQPEHDARHDLNKWLARCSPNLHETLREPQIRSKWSFICTDWRNSLRYWPYTQWLSYARKRPDWRKLKGDDDARLREYTRQLVRAAQLVHMKGLAEWQRRNS